MDPVTLTNPASINSFMSCMLYCWPTSFIFPLARNRSSPNCLQELLNSKSLPDEDFVIVWFSHAHKHGYFSQVIPTSWKQSSGAMSCSCSLTPPCTPPHTASCWNSSVQAAWTRYKWPHSLLRQWQVSGPRQLPTDCAAQPCFPASQSQSGRPYWRTYTLHLLYFQRTLLLKIPHGVRQCLPFPPEAARNSPPLSTARANTVHTHATLSGVQFNSPVFRAVSLTLLMTFVATTEIAENRGKAGTEFLSLKRFGCHCVQQQAHIFPAQPLLLISWWKLVLWPLMSPASLNPSYSAPFAFQPCPLVPHLTTVAISFPLRS